MPKNQLEVFRQRLEQLKEQGVDIDPDKVTEEIINPQIPEDTSDEERREKLYNLTVQKVIQLLDDFKNHYQPKGRTLKVIIRIEKENSADAFGEKFVYDEDIEVISMIEIGTKGKYEKVIQGDK
jgi:hypothetical protein